MEILFSISVASLLAFLMVSTIELFLYKRAIFMLFDLDNKIDNMVFQKESPYCYSLSYDDYTMEVVLLENQAKTDSLYMFKKQEQSIYFHSLNTSFLCRTILRKKTSELY